MRSCSQECCQQHRLCRLLVETFEGSVMMCSEYCWLPNEMRLSCGAMLSLSQTDGLHRKTAPPASSAC